MVARNAPFGLMLVILATICGRISPLAAQTWTSEYQHAKVLSVREVRHASFPVSRYPTTPQYTIALVVLMGNQTYCVAYETPVLDEVHDLEAADGREVEVAANGRKVVFMLPNGRRIHANFVKLSEC